MLVIFAVLMMLSRWSRLISVVLMKKLVVVFQAEYVANPMVIKTVEAESPMSTVHLVHVKVPRIPCFNAFSAPEINDLKVFVRKISFF